MDENTEECGTGRLRVVEENTIPEVSAHIKLTENAKRELESALSNSPSSAGLRLEVMSWGCSGHLYDMRIVDAPQKTDQILNLEGIPVFIRRVDSILLDGCTIDYLNSLMNGGFKVENPNAMATCGCGLSFA